MKTDTWLKLRKEFPVIFTATVTCLLATALFQKDNFKLFSMDTVETVLAVLFFSILSSVIIYLIYYWIYKNTTENNKGGWG